MSVRWLDEMAADRRDEAGSKAATLARLRRAGLPVPDGFVLTVSALAEGPPGDVRRAAVEAYARLVGAASGALVAVRSSATAEDLADASLAGMQETVLNVRGEAALLDAVDRVVASLESAPARAYRERAALDESRMAVLVQRQVPARVAGVAFGRDPISAEAVILIEAVAGLGDVLASGAADPQQWRVERGAGAPLLSGPEQPLLPPTAIQRLAALVRDAEHVLGQALDIEWAWDGAAFWLLQARPITTRHEDWFTDHLPGDAALWTAAFLNERFTAPVSPLGWSLVAGLLERLALREPLAMLGVSAPPRPLLKLWRGHPYSRVLAWQQIYKLFPVRLLPEDAARYFPEGDLVLRHAPAMPVLSPALLGAALRTLVERPRVRSPLHNPAAWSRYEGRQAARLIRLRFEAGRCDPSAGEAPLRDLLVRSQGLTEELLEIHRWSLLYADLFYSLLRRLLRRRYGAAEGARHVAAWTRDADQTTTRLNAALQALAAQRTEPVVGALLERWAASTAGTRLAEVEGSEARPDFVAAVEQFLSRHGHRFFSLDLYDPPWSEDGPAFAAVLRSLQPPPPSTGRDDGPRPPTWLLPLLRLTREYLRLREAQRYHWQEIMAFQRQIFLRLGALWTASGALERPEEIFGMTWEAVLAERPNGLQAARRLARLERLRTQARAAPGWHYPDFLRGNRPLLAGRAGERLVGRPVSPGVARGPARLIAHPGDFDRVQPGDILVTTSPDPGWTPLFGTVAALITERGGQLSHGAVVAREYRLPAVSGLPALLSTLVEGEPLLVDGTQGIVLRLNQISGSESELERPADE